MSALAVAQETRRWGDQVGVAIRPRQTELFEEVFREAMAAWRESRREQVRVRRTSGRTMRGKGGEVVPLPDLVVTETLPGKGDPRYLSQALRAVAEIGRQGAQESPAKAPRGGTQAPAAGQPREEAEMVNPSGTDADMRAAMRRFLSVVADAGDVDDREMAHSLSGLPAADADEAPGESPPLNRAARRRQERAARKRR